MFYFLLGAGGRKIRYFLEISVELIEMQYFVIAHFIKYSACHFRMVFFFNFMYFSEP